MTTIQQPRWVSRKLVAIACAVSCMLLFATTTATAAGAQRSSTSTRTPPACLRNHRRRCASSARRAFNRVSSRTTATQARLRSRRLEGRRVNISKRSGASGGDFGSTPSGGSGGSTAGGAGSSTSGTGSSGASDTGPSTSDTGFSASGALSSGEAPAAPAPAQESPQQSSATFQPGINSGSAALWELPGAVQLGAKVVRIGLEIDEPLQAIEPIVAAYAADGIRVAPLAEFNGRLPSPAEAANLAGWAKAFGPGGTFWATHPGGQYAIQTIEFGNETSLSWQYSASEDTPAGYASRAQTYALRFAEAASAIKAANAGVGLLAQGDSGNAGPIWVESMFEAVPDLASLVAGWTVHPYGPRWRSKLEELVSQTAAAGAPSSIPIDITEWGLSSDNGACLSENYGWNPCMSYQEAAETLSRTVGEMREMLHGRLELLLLYKIRDQKAPGESTSREDYFGALQSELQPKGAYTTAVESFLASS
jgi:hypothetical protein